jgi:hypothetical protein
LPTLIAAKLTLLILTAETSRATAAEGTLTTALTQKKLADLLQSNAGDNG